MQLEQFITTYGYLAVLAGTFLEGETVLIMAGFLAHRGYLHLSWVVVAAFVGTLCGDQLYYQLGRRKGMAFLERRVSWKPRIERLRGMLHRNRIAVILGFRFLYGLRTITPFLLGASGIPPCRFTALNGVGAAAWSVLVASLGYSVGMAVGLFLTRVKRYEMAILGAIVAAGALTWLIHFSRERNRT
jgi:membrane protein DedA with SNARE-associated domain